MNVVNRIMDKICTRENVGDWKDKNYMASITYVGTRTKSVVICFKMYHIDVEIKKCVTV